MLSCSAMLPVEAFIECLFLRLSEIFVERPVLNVLFYLDF